MNSRALEDGRADAPVLAIDPGRVRCGIAVAARDGAVAERMVCPVEELRERLAAIAVAHKPGQIVLGGGTNSAALRRLLVDILPELPLEVVEESHTSEEARKRFVAEVPARGWQRLLPISLRTPDRPYDDFVAVILAERYWRAHPAQE